jgi:transposase
MPRPRRRCRRPTRALDPQIESRGDSCGARFVIPFPYGEVIPMSRPYSTDLRERIVAFVEAGHSCRQAAAHFQVSVSFVVKLMKAYRSSGRISARPMGGRRHAKLDAHRNFLVRRISEQKDITMGELAAELMTETGTRADPASLCRWFRRNNYRVKKNAAGRRTRSPGRPASARGMDQRPPAQNAA